MRFVVVSTIYAGVQQENGSGLATQPGDRNSDHEPVVRTSRGESKRVTLTRRSVQMGDGGRVLLHLFCFVLAKPRRTHDGLGGTSPIF